MDSLQPASAAYRGSNPRLPDFLEEPPLSSVGSVSISDMSASDNDGPTTWTKAALSSLGSVSSRSDGHAMCVAVETANLPLKANRDRQWRNVLHYIRRHPPHALSIVCLS
jgi:hypothetical protein